MQRNNLFRTVRATAFTMLATLYGYRAATKESGGGTSVITSKTTSASPEGWYAAPWVWIVGAAVFILLLVAILNNRNNRRSA